MLEFGLDEKVCNSSPSPGEASLNHFVWFGNRFSRIGLRNGIFLKKLGSWGQNFAKISVLGAETWPKLEGIEPEIPRKIWKIENGRHRNWH